MLRLSSAAFVFVALLALLPVACTVQTPQENKPAAPATSAAPQMKYGVPVVGGPMDSILLKDYRPASSLKVPETHPAKPRVPVIDVHAHDYASTPAEVSEWVRTMDETGVERTVVLTDVVGADFDRMVELYLKPYPNRFQLFCGIDTKDPDAPDYPERAVRELVRCYNRGARGVGEVSDKGWGINGSAESHLPRDKRLHPDDPRLGAFWEKCAELKIPVNMHIADHPSCWQPLGPEQERTPDFQVFNLSGKDVPSYEELLAARDRALAAHPNTRFIACHFSNQGNDLEALAKVLDRFPNLFVDIAARDYEIGRQPRTAAKFLARYKDRVLFGTDMGREKDVYLGWWRLLETGDEYIPGRIWWRYYGLDLPEPLLGALYRDNALRLLNWKS